MHNTWKIYKLGDVADIQNGFAFASRDFTSRGIPIIKIKNVIPPYINFEQAEYYDLPLNSALDKYIVKKDDILISMTGSTVNQMSSAVGKIARYKFDFPALLNQRVGKFYLHNHKIVNYDYLYYYISRFEIQHNLALNATGSANQANISPSQIKDIELTLPPLSEQEAIAEILSSLDDKIELNLQTNKTLEEMANALYKHWFVDFGPFKDGAFIESELGLIPEGWKVYNLLEVCETIFSGGTPSTTNIEYWNGNIPWLSSGETRNKYIIETDKTITDLGLKESSARYAQKSDTVIASAGQGKTRGQTSYLFINTTVNQSVLCFRSNKLIISPILLFLNLSDRYEEFRHISDSYSTRGSLTKDLIGKQIKFCFPDIEIQNDLNDKLEDCFLHIENLLLENESLKQTRDYLLPKLISGEIRVKEARKAVKELV